MKITFLGSGGAFSDYRINYQNNALIETEEGPVLIDCGFTACQSLRELQIHPSRIRAVLFTHLHGDHASPEQLIWERYYTGPDGRPGFLPTLMVAPGDLMRPLKRSLEAYIDIYSNRLGEVRRGGVEALIDAHITNEVEIGGVSFRFFRVPHVTSQTIDKAAFGLRIQQGNKVVYWSGDTTFSLPWIEAAAAEQNTIHIFHECTFTPHFSGTVHTHYSELLTLPEPTQRIITLMHHTQVPVGVDVSMFHDAARRHQIFKL